MANIKSAKKRNLTNERARMRNASIKSRVRTYLKRANAALDAKDKDAALKVLPEALAVIDKAASKGVLHKNTASRKKSVLQRKAAAL